MVAAEVVVEELFAKRLVDVLLRGIVRVALVVRPEGAVEGELLVLDERSALVLWVDLGGEQRCLLGGRVHTNEAFGPLVPLCGALALATRQVCASETCLASKRSCIAPRP